MDCVTLFKAITIFFFIFSFLNFRVIKMLEKVFDYTK